MVVETDLIKAEIDTNGGDLRQFELLDYPVSLDEMDTPFTLLNDVGADLFIIQGGLLGAEHDSPNHHTLFEARTNNVRLAPGDDSVSVDLDWESKEGVRYTKTFTFYRDSYFVDVVFTINNQSGKEWVGYQYEQILRTEVAEPSTGIGFLGRLPSYKGGAILRPKINIKKLTSTICLMPIWQNRHRRDGLRCCNIILWARCCRRLARVTSFTVT